ncbi:21404_t:CDS:2, partial [Dentiscutata erythropus]
MEANNKKEGYQERINKTIFRETNEEFYNPMMQTKIIKEIKNKKIDILKKEVQQSIAYKRMREMLQDKDKKVSQLLYPKFRNDEYIRNDSNQYSNKQEIKKILKNKAIQIIVPDPKNWTEKTRNEILEELGFEMNPERLQFIKIHRYLSHNKSGTQSTTTNNPDYTKTPYYIEIAMYLYLVLPHENFLITYNEPQNMNYLEEWILLEKITNNCIKKQFPNQEISEEYKTPYNGDEQNNSAEKLNYL